MIYRRFWLTNANKETWAFSDKEFKCYLNEPEGLGLSNTIKTVQYGERLKIEKIEHSFPVVSGKLMFCDGDNAERYKKYHRLVRFLSYAPLTLTYEIPLKQPRRYSIECYVTSLGKTESSSNRILECSIEFTGLSFWCGEEQTINSTGTSFSLSNPGDFPAGFEITIEGTDLDNPYFTLSNSDGIYGEAKFNGTFSSIYVNSKDSEQEVILEQDGSVLPNPLSYQDLSISNGSIYVTFVKLARGTTTLEIGMDSGTLSNVEIKYIPMYRSV